MTPQYHCTFCLCHQPFLLQHSTTANNNYNLSTTFTPPFPKSKTTPIRTKTPSTTLRKVHQTPSSLFFRRDQNQNHHTSTSQPPKNSNTPSIQIAAPVPNTRSIISEIHINAPPHLVWSVLSDYSNLASIVPNLAISRVKGVRQYDNATILEQRGVQKIFGFEFAASVVLGMKEVHGKVIEFDLVESRDFRRFMGRWLIHGVEEDVVVEQGEGGQEIVGTRLTYEVTVSPKGLVPVKAIEWRIKEDVPGNMIALKRHCETLERKLKRREMIQQQNGNNNNGNTNGLSFSPVRVKNVDIKVS